MTRNKPNRFKKYSNVILGREIRVERRKKQPIDKCEICLNCDKPQCKGYCEKIRNK